jgi:hypothetical protein
VLWMDEGTKPPERTCVDTLPRSRSGHEEKSFENLKIDVDLMCYECNINECYNCNTR